MPLECVFVFQFYQFKALQKAWNVFHLVEDESIHLWVIQNQDHTNITIIDPSSNPSIWNHIQFINKNASKVYRKKKLSVPLLNFNHYFVWFYVETNIESLAYSNGIWQNKVWFAMICQIIWSNVLHMPLKYKSEKCHNYIFHLSKWQKGHEGNKVERCKSLKVLHLKMAKLL